MIIKFVVSTFICHDDDDKKYGNFDNDVA